MSLFLGFSLHGFLECIVILVPVFLKPQIAKFQVQFSKIILGARTLSYLLLFMVSLSLVQLTFHQYEMGDTELVKRLQPVTGEDIPTITLCSNTNLTVFD